MGAGELREIPVADNKHTPSKPAPKDSFPAKSPAHPAPSSSDPKPKTEGQQGQQGHVPGSKYDPNDPNRTAGYGKDGDPVEPVVRRTETLPTDPHAGQAVQRDEPVRMARHAETEEELEKIQDMEHSKIPPPGSRNYVAGQPVNEEEWERTEREANRLADAGRAQRTEAEQRMKENTPGDPDYHPVDPDHRDPDGGRKGQSDAERDRQHREKDRK